MIYNEAFWVILAIFIWVLLALLVVTLMADTFVRIVYYKWDKDDRETMTIENKVGEIIEAKNNPDGVMEETENNPG